MDTTINLASVCLDVFVVLAEFKPFYVRKNDCIQSYFFIVDIIFALILSVCSKRGM